MFSFLYETFDSFELKCFALSYNFGKFSEALHLNASNFIVWFVFI